jgi:hypothetical protein
MCFEEPEFDNSDCVYETHVESINEIFINHLLRNNLIR